MKPHHGTILELTSGESIEIFSRNHFGHVATSWDHEAHIVPISYSFYDGSINSHSKPGKKIELMRKKSPSLLPDRRNCRLLAVKNFLVISAMAFS